jgi:hypothetical protein
VAAGGVGERGGDRVAAVQPGSLGRFSGAHGSRTLTWAGVCR